MYGHREGEEGTCMDTERVRCVHVWTHRGWGGYMYGHRGWGGYMYGHLESGLGKCMDTQRVRGYMHGHTEGEVGTRMDT